MLRIFTSSEVVETEDTSLLFLLFILQSRAMSVQSNKVVIVLRLTRDARNPSRYSFGVTCVSAQACVWVEKYWQEFVGNM